MAARDWSQCTAVESVPGRLNGAWVFRNTRMPVSAVFENLEAGASIEEIIEQSSSNSTSRENKSTRSWNLPLAALIRPLLFLDRPRMLMLFDHVTPGGIAGALSDHTIVKAKDRGSDTLSNGELLAQAQRAGFDPLLTAAKI